MVRKICICMLLLSVLVFCRQEEAHTWGFFAHKRINKMAVFTLPEGMIGFYKHHIDFISDHAVDPDKRRYAVEGEAQRHYIDIDHYRKQGEDPFKLVPRNWTDAVTAFTEDTLQAYGIVPWHINVMYYRLIDAFKEENVDKILHLSADIGHYIGDAHVPLHTTENYNGQLTNQKGIHGFWESRIPELYAENYDYWTGKAAYIQKPLDVAWETVKESHMAVDTVLGFEKKLNDATEADKKYAYENRGRIMMKVYSEEYTKKYNEMLNGMVERRMRQAIISVGSFWYSAWIKAGQPDLNKLIGVEFIPENDAELDSAYVKGKTKGRSCDDH
jgi:hypothetical protein